jgi:cytochrome c oxidase subunit 4
MAELAYLNGKLIDDPHENHHHVSPVWMYVAVFVALVVLTIVTYVVSFANLGPMSLLVAMVVAVTKASLVIAFFMHLAYEDRFYLFIFLTAFLGIFIFFAFILFDISASGDLHDDADLGVPRIERDVAATETEAEPHALPKPAREHLFQ